jgi:hypothetical protein
LALDFAGWVDKYWFMQWRPGVSVFVGALAVSLAVTGCARKERGVRNNAPIREETTTVAVPVVTEAPTTAAPTTVALTLPDVPSTDPKPVGDDYRGTVIVKAVPKTDLEREILDATVDLLAKRRQLALLNTNDRSVLGEVMTGQALEEYLSLGKDVIGRTVSVPSGIDRTLITEVIQTFPDSGIVRVCEVDGASTYSEGPSSYSLLNKDVATNKLEIQIVRTIDGWRIGVDTVLDVLVGDKCEN